MSYRPLCIGPASIALFVVSACAGPAAGTAPQSFAPNALALTASRMSPGAKQEKSLLYVSSVLTNDVYVYSYPKGTLEGTLTGFNIPYGLCGDRSGNVFIVNDGASQILEYAHGASTPFATYVDSGEFPEGCAVDPATNDLAVTNFYGTSGNGNVAIYQGYDPPVFYTDPNIIEYRFCSFDDKGNLFVDGVGPGSKFVFAELPKGQSTFKDIPIQKSIGWPGGVAFDGKDIALGDSDLNGAYRVTKSGKILREFGLVGSKYVNQLWIVPGEKGKSNLMQARIVAPSQDANFVGIYPYPKGGDYVKTIDVQEPFGATVSSI
jgi:hypothetical protein